MKYQDEKPIIKTTKKKTKYIVVNDDSETESEDEVKIIKTKSKHKTTKPQIRPIIQPQIQPLITNKKMMTHLYHQMMSIMF